MPLKELYVVIQIVCNIVASFVIYKLMHAFLGNNVKNKKIEKITYLVYYALSLHFILAVYIPIVMLVFNLLAFFALTLNFAVAWKERLLAVIYTCSILLGIEMLVAVVTGYFYFPVGMPSEYFSIYGLIVNQLLGLMLANIISSVRQGKKVWSLPWAYWSCVIVFPAFSICSLVVIFNMGTVNRVFLLTFLCLILLMNLSVFVMYDLAMDAMELKTKELLRRQQNGFFSAQLALLKMSAQQNKSMRHDLSEHLVTIRVYLEKKLLDEAIGYIDKMLNITSINQYKFVDSGNIVIDGMLNWKIQEAADKDISITYNVKVPDSLQIDDFDITVVLGNLLDNALEASAKSSGKRKIKIILLYDRQRLIISVKNSYAGFVHKKHGKILSTKPDKQNHGIGLKNVREVVEKYNGSIRIDHDAHYFYVDVILQLSFTTNNS